MTVSTVQFVHVKLANSVASFSIGVIFTPQSRGKVLKSDNTEYLSDL